MHDDFTSINRLDQEQEALADGDGSADEGQQELVLYPGDSITIRLHDGRILFVRATDTRTPSPSPAPAPSRNQALPVTPGLQVDPQRRPYRPPMFDPGEPPDKILLLKPDTWELAVPGHINDLFEGDYPSSWPNVSAHVGRVRGEKIAYVVDLPDLM